MADVCDGMGIGTASSRVHVFFSLLSSLLLLCASRFLEAVEGIVFFSKQRPYGSTRIGSKERGTKQLARPVQCRADQ